MTRTLRSRTSRWLAAGAFSLALCGPAAAQFPNGPCWETNLGMAMGAGDDWSSGPIQLPFNFPLPGGGTSNLIDVSSNGFVWLDANDPNNNGYDLSESVSELLTLGPRIAVLWNDLTPTSSGTFTGGDVYVNTSFATRAVITWQMRDFLYSDPVTAQLQLNSDGSFSIKYRELPGTPTDGIIGVSPGGGAIDPGPVSFTQPILLGGGTTIYMSGRSSALAGTGLLFLKTALGYDVANLPSCYQPPASATAYGAGCPRPTGGSLFEFFEGGADPFDLPAGASVLYMNVGNGYGVQAGGTGAFDPNYGTQVLWNGTGDDSLSTQALPFAFPLPGGGTTSSIDVCSNGFVWLVSGSSTTTGYRPAVADFTSPTYPARIAALWCDLNNNLGSTTGGGTVAFTASATRAVITWDQVPSYGNIGSVSTVQLQLFSNGNFQIVYQSVNANATTSGATVLTGVTVGNNTVTPFETDMTTQLPNYMPFAQTAASPVTLAAAAGSRPLLGSPFTWEASNLNGSPAAILFVGFSNPNAPLDSIGMTGCRLHTALTAQAPMTVSGGIGTFTLTVPGAPALLGGTAYSQIVVLAAVNPLGLATSNGVKLTLSNY